MKTGGEEVIDKSRPVSGAALQLGDDCVPAFQEMKVRRKHRFIVFKVGETCINVEVFGERKFTLAQFKEKLPFTECRFALYDHDYKSPDGRPISRIYFIIWLPHNATAYTKMAYAQAKAKFNEAMGGIYDAQVASIEQLDIALGAEEEEEDNEFNDDDF